MVCCNIVACSYLFFFFPFCLLQRRELHIEACTGARRVICSPTNITVNSDGILFIRVVSTVCFGDVQPTSVLWTPW